MKCSFYLLTLLLAAATITQAQNPSWQWAKSAGGTSYEEGSSVCTDASGNVLVTGFFSSDSITFGNTTLTNSGPAGNGNVFVVKYDASGSVLWAKSADGTGAARSICTDANGNVLITGMFASTSITFGTTTVTNADTAGYYGFNDMFVVRYDSSGNVLWTQSAGGEGDEISLGIATDASGNAYVTGSFYSDSIAFGATILTNTSNAGNNNYDMFVVKYDASGNVLWAQSAQGGFTTSQAVSTDVSGNVLLTGYFNSSITFGTTTLTNASTVGDNAFFVVKYDASGNVLWAHTTAGLAGGAGFGISTDASQNVLVTGTFVLASITFGTVTLNNANPAGSYDIFVVKYDPSGNVLWARSAGGTEYDFSTGIATDASGNVLVTGSFYSDSISFDNTTLTIAGTYGSSYVVKYDASGAVLWAKSAGGISSYDSGNAISSDAGGNVLVTGYFASDSITFGTITLTNTAAGSEDMFVAKLGSPCLGNPPAQPAAIAGTASVCASSQQTYFVDSVSGATFYTWTLPNGWTGSSSTNSITATVGTTGSILVTAVNSCGSSLAQTFSVTVNPAPTPTAAVSANQLSTTSGQGTYQWYFNGTIINGATNATYSATANGDYYVVVTNANSCSAQSNTVTVSGLDIETISTISFTVFPNPFNTALRFSSLNKLGIVRVTDALGKEVWSGNVQTFTLELPTEDWSSGLYFVHICIATAMLVKE